MQFSFSRNCVLGAMLTAASVGSFAQMADPAKPASSPTTVGVTPQDAAAANQKAVPRADTATVVRTGPTATERARTTATGVAANMPSASGTDGGMLPARPDRN